VQFDQFGFAVQKYPAVRSAISDESKRRGGH
jgi:hypothetical protein